MSRKPDHKSGLTGLVSGFVMGKHFVRPQAGELSRIRAFIPRRFHGNQHKQHIEPKAMRVLLALATHQGEFVSKNDLIDEVWDGRPVTDDVLTHAIHSLRSALNDDPRDPQYIETRSNVGYRLLVPVRPAGMQSKNRFGWVIASAVIVLCFLLAGVMYNKQGPQAQTERLTTIAVLPFLNLSGENEMDFLSDAMTEALILNLAHQPGFRVISRSSVMAFKGHKSPAGSIARELGADLLVEGSVQATGGDIRVVAQLIEPVEDDHLWAGHFDRKLQNVLGLQQEVAGAIASRIGNVMSGNAAVNADVTQYVPESDLHEYLQARYWLAHGEVENGLLALQTFQSLTQKFPDFSPAYLGQAQAGLFLFKAGVLDYPALNQALDAALTFESQAGVSAESQRCIGQIRLLADWNFNAAESHYQTALTLNPSDTIARRRYAWLLVAQQRYTDAAEQIQQIRLLDPLYYDNAEMATLLLYSGQVDAAVTEFERIKGATELNQAVLRGMAVAYLAAGEEGKAHATLVSLLTRIDDAPPGQLEKLSVDELYQYVIQARPFRSSIAIAGFHNLAGNQSAALDALELAVQQRDPFSLYIGAMPELASLHAEPRFKALLFRIGVRPENPDHLRQTRLFSAILRNPQANTRDN